MPVAEAYEELVRAIAQLRSVRGGLLFLSDRALREPNAQAIRAARASVDRVRMLMERLAIEREQWNDVVRTVGALPNVVIMEPFCGVDIRGARTVEAAGAKSDVKKLERVRQRMREIVQARADQALISELARIDEHHQA